MAHCHREGMRNKRVGGEVDSVRGSLSAHSGALLWLSTPLRGGCQAMRWNTPVPPQFPPWGFLPLPSPAAASKQSHLSPVTPHQSQKLSLKNWPTRLHNEYMHLIIQILTPLLEGFPADIFSTTADQEICCHTKNLSSKILCWSLILRSLFLPQRIAYCPRKQYQLSVV